ncbi:glycosyltransferase family 4 protein [Luteibacter yeojuensis]
MAERLREHFLESLGADVILTASMVDGFFDSVVTSVPERSRALQVGILFDLIPMVMPELYLVLEGVAPWYRAKIEHLRRCDLLLAISQAARDEAIELLGLDGGRIVNVSAAVGDDFGRIEPSLNPSAVGRRYGVSRPFVMYAGGFDPRKNLASLIAAYASLSPAVRSGHQLVFVGNIDKKERDELVAVRDASGLTDDELIFTGFVSDAELVRLYNACKLYVFPSLHEGFGLPALEAMACGAVVVGSSTTSLPEVIGAAEALFDPRDTASIAAKIMQGLTDEAFRDRMKRHAERHVTTFSWETSADMAWQAIESAVPASSSRTPPARNDEPGERLALLAARPVSLADFEALNLGSSRGVDLFSSAAGQEVVGGSLPAGWRRRSLSTFDPRTAGDVLVQVSDDPGTVAVLQAVRGIPAQLWFVDASYGRVLERMRHDDERLLAAILYGAGGYRALGFIKQAGEAAFSSLPADAIARGDTVWSSFSEREKVNARAALIEEVAGIPGVAAWARDDVSRLAMAVAANAPVHRPARTLYVDVSHLVIEDAKTGIQRVVRNITAGLMAAPPEGFRVEPVYIRPDGVFRHAREWCARQFYDGASLPPDAPVEFRQGDIFVGLDLAAHLVPYLRDTYVRMRSRGVDVHFVVYDLLPLLRPDCFDENGLPTFRLWYEAIAELADGIICISRTVADEFKQWLGQAMPVRTRPLRIDWFHLGADLVPTARADGAVGVLPFDLRGRPTFLMVGTIEPRKGHAQTLAAFETLWERGHDVNLVLIGKPGWRVESLVTRLREHAQAGKRLFWLERADDSQLVAMYQTASALLAPSEGEGFGLPLIEAAQYGRPIIARDLPVFKEVAGEHAFYFSGTDPEAMAAAVERWLELDRAGLAPPSAGMPWLTWSQSARQLASVAVSSHWYDSWTPCAARHFKASDYRATFTTGRLVRGERISERAPGVLYATPFIQLKAGDYELRVAGSRQNGAGTAWLDVEAHGGAWRIGSAVLSEGEDLIAQLNICVHEDVDDLCIRVMVDGDAEVVFRDMDLAPVEESDRRKFPELESTGFVVDNSESR